MDVFQKSVKLHRQYRGKIATQLKFPVETREDLSLAYTPGVGEVSAQIADGRLDINQVTARGNTIAVISDGSAVLGLGNIGPFGAYPVMEGKALLFKRFGGVDAVPLVISTQDPIEIIKFVTQLAPSFAGINLEDISAPRCFEIEKTLKHNLNIPVFHDDQHGTAIVVLAALINALKLVGKTASCIKVVISGAGAAGIATAGLLFRYGVGQLIMTDSRGIIYPGRSHLNPYKLAVAKQGNPAKISGNLVDAIRQADVFIGLSAPGIVTTEMVESMAKRPIVIAMANPVPEIMPDEAKAGGAYIIATGRSDFPNQVNNVLAFPGIFRGAIDNQVTQITDQHKLIAARALAKLVIDPNPSRIIPDLFDPRVTTTVAAVIR